LNGSSGEAVDPKSGVIGGFTRGLNLGNALDAPSEGEWGVTLTEQHFEGVATAGLDHVRLPVRFSAHAAHQRPFTLEPSFLQRVDWAIERATVRRLSVVVDLHHYNELMDDPKAHMERFVAIWRQIAERYKDRPPTVAFELVNEPCKNLTPVLLNELVKQTIPVVRESNPTRLIIVDSYSWAASEYLNKLELPEDARIVASFHMYQPILFTHQGADWMGPEYQTEGVVFPGPPPQPLQPAAGAQSLEWVRNWFRDYNSLPAATNPSGPGAIARQFEFASKYVATTGKRVYLGEFAAIDKADPTSRENFLRITRTEAERRGFGWAYWDDGGRNRALDVKTGSWVPEVERALF